MDGLATLLTVIAHDHRDVTWKHRGEDGDTFVIGVGTPCGPAVFRLDMSLWGDFDCGEADELPELDDGAEGEALDRVGTLARGGGAMSVSGRDDLTGMRFGHLTAIRRTDDIGGRARWVCECECGRHKKCMADHLVMGYARSCGECGLQREHPRWFTDEENARMAEMWAADATVADIADEFGTTRATIYRYIRKRRSEFPSRKAGLPKETTEAIDSMWADGLKVKAIAHRAHCTVEAVRHYLNTHRDRCPQRFVKVSDEEADEMERMFREGNTVLEIAAYYGVSESTARKYAFGRHRKSGDGV